MCDRSYTWMAMGTKPGCCGEEHNFLASLEMWISQMQVNGRINGTCYIRKWRVKKVMWKMLLLYSYSIWLYHEMFWYQWHRRLTIINSNWQLPKQKLIFVAPLCNEGYHYFLHPIIINKTQVENQDTEIIRSKRVPNFMRSISHSLDLIIREHNICTLCITIYASMHSKNNSN